MNKFVSLLIVLLAIAVATPVLAEDRLSLSGVMRVRGFHIDTDGAANTNTFANQRLNLTSKLSVAEGVSVSFNVQLQEAEWGNQARGTTFTATAPQTNVNSEALQVNTVHLDLDRSMFHLRAGNQFLALGQHGFDAVSTGLALNIKGQMPVTLFAMLPENNGRAAADAFWVGANVGHKTDMYSANVFTALAQDSTIDQEIYLLGMNANFNFDAFKLYTEVDYFGGDVNATTEAYGLQAVVDVSAAVAENVTVGGEFFYAMGDKDDQQFAILGNDDTGRDNIFAIGTSSNIAASSIKGYGRVFNVLGDGTGIYAGRLYASMKASDQVSVAASAMYGVADEKDVANSYKDILAVAAGLKYDFMPKTFINFQVQYRDMSKENAATDLERFDVGTALVVSF